MPHLDVIDEMRQSRDLLLKLAKRRGGDDLADAISKVFELLIEHVDDERKEWEATLELVIEKVRARDEEDDDE